MGTLQPRLPKTVAQLHAEIDRVVSCAIQRPQGPRAEAILGRVPPSVAERVRAATGLDVSNYFFRLDSYGVRHSYLQHHVEALESAQGQRAVLPADFHHLPRVYAAPDKIEDGGTNRNGRRVVRFIKRIDGIMVVAEEVLTGRRCLALQTLLIRKAEAAEESRPARDTAIGVSLSTADTDRSEEILIRPEAAVNSAPGVDLYVGGTEHAVLHLLYARFWHKVLYDLGHVSTPEPFFRLVNQGLILGEDGQKMSKSRGNVVNPDDILREYGADAFRLYEMFMGPLQDTKPWSTKGVEGVYRFLGRVWRLFVDEHSETEFEQAETAGTFADPQEALRLIRLHPAIQNTQPTPAQLKTLHACIRKVTEDLEELRFNTAISALMVFVNEALAWPTRPASVLRTFVILLHPFAPHLAEELWEKLHAAFALERADLAYAPWPQFDPALLVEDTLEIPVQVNGRLRDVIRVPANADDAALESAARASARVQQFLAGKTVRKVIIVPKKLVNLIAN
ncbi:MAG: class I tRNA ligase family protein [Verrucomicrobiae bacterium]|nr:class I tRNA ligase family protein [Verrucomicrobiae bacterium]